MSDTAANQLRRVMRLVAEVSRGESYTVAALAKRLGVTKKVLTSDLVALTERYDLPGGFVEGVRVDWDKDGVTAMTPHFRRPMRLTNRELCALQLALSMLRLVRSPAEHDAINRAVEKLRLAITDGKDDGSWEEAHHVELGSVGDRHLPLLRNAVRERRKLLVKYRSSGGEETTRTLRPYGVVFGRGTWYLVAWCEQHKSVRTFRLDRMRSVEPQGEERFARPAGFSLEKLFEGDKVLITKATETMTVRYSARVAPWIAEREGKPLAKDGSLTLEHPMADRAWALRHVLQYGAEAEVLEPQSLRTEIAERVRLLLA